METSDLTVQILREIRDKMDENRQAIEATNVELRTMRTELGDRLASVEERVGSLEQVMIEETEATRAVLEQVKKLLGGRRQLTKRVENCEHEIAELKKKVG